MRFFSSSDFSPHIMAIVEVLTKEKKSFCQLHSTTFLCTYSHREENIPTLFFLKKYFFLALSSDFTWSNSPCFKFSVKKLGENCQISTLRGEITKKIRENFFAITFHGKTKKIKQLCKIFQKKIVFKKKFTFLFVL